MPEPYISAQGTQPISWAEFAELLKQHCFGDWWDNVPPLEANPTWGDCEACTNHPLSAEDAALLNRLFDFMKKAGAPSPSSAYPHCAGDIFVEWHSKDYDKCVVLDLKNKFGRDALVRVPPNPTYFVKVGDS